MILATWLTWLIGLAQAGELGVRLDLYPRAEQQDVDAQLQWTPWLRWNNEDWIFKGTLGVDGEYTQSQTAETKTHSRQSQVLLGGEVEKRIRGENADGKSAEWLVGIGLQSNIPILSQYSSLYTDTEQQDVDAQLQNQFAEQAYTAFSLPVTFMIPIKEDFAVGLGARGTYRIRRTSSDFQTTYSSEMSLIPMLSIEGKAK